MGKKKRVTGIIRVYSRKARNQLVEIGMVFFKESEITGYIDDVFACVDELIKNAVKANYKFLLIMDKIQETLIKDKPDRDKEEIKSSTFEIIRDKKMFDRIAQNVNRNEGISTEVREILNEEAKHLSIKNRAFDEGREYTDKEKNIISGLTKLKKIRKQMKERDIKILLNIESDGDFIYIEITNTAPILSQDLKRIHEKRDEYKQYKVLGKEYEFFVNNIDTSESGFGLGYATIDSFLANMGLNTESSVTIVSANNTTAMLTLPVEKLRQTTP